MKLSEFKIGESFWCSGKQYRCTDIGTRVVVGIRIDHVEVVHHSVDSPLEVLPFEQADKEGWFDGPPYAVAEQTFDETDIVVCHVVQLKV